MPAELLVGPDGVARCPWPGSDPLYVAYHDDDWGRPVRDERELFEKLILDGAQAGLAWITILRKREGYRRAFEGFDPERIAAYGPDDVARLLADPGIVRNRQKVAAAIANAQALLAMHDAGETLVDLVWSHGRQPIPCCELATTIRSRRRRPRRSRRRCGTAAGSSSARRSSTPSCRPSAWSTTTSRAAPSATERNEAIAPVGE